MVFSRNEDRHSLALRGVPQPPRHVEPLGDRQAEPFREAIALARVERELHAQKERAALRVSGVLVRAHDVGASLEQEARDGADDPRPVRTGDEQAEEQGPLVGHQPAALIGRRSSATPPRTRAGP